MSCPDVAPWEGDIPMVDMVFATASPGRGFVSWGAGREGPSTPDVEGPFLSLLRVWDTHSVTPGQEGGPGAKLVAALSPSLQVPSMGHCRGGGMEGTEGGHWAPREGQDPQSSTQR